MAVVAPTRQNGFQTAVLMLSDQLSAYGLKKHGERATVKGVENHKFYRKKKATAQNGIPTMFTAGALTTTGGDFVSYTATIQQISSQDKLSEVDEKRTKLDLKSPLVKSMVNAVLTREDELIIQAIATSPTPLATGGNATLPIDDDANIKELIQKVRSAHVWTKRGLNDKGGVAVVMCESDYIKLASSDFFLNGDYADAFGGGTGDVPLSFVGAELVIIDSTLVPAGTIYIIPQNTFGFAEWENSVVADKVFVPTDGRRWHLQVSKSVGVALIEPDKMTQFSVLP